MKSSMGAILLLGFGTLVALVAVLGFSAYHRADQIETETAAIHERFRQKALVLNQTKEDTYLASIIIRDYLLDPSPESALHHKEELSAIRALIGNHLKSLTKLLSSDEEKTLARHLLEFDIYWTSLEPVFHWTPKQKIALASLFLRTEVIPRRVALISSMHEIDVLSAETFKKEQETIAANRMEFQSYLRKMIALSVILAIGVAVISALRVSILDRRSENQRQRAENAEKELRRLSQQLLHAQEEERKSISRELHDEIGQMLTGLKMELGSLEVFRNVPTDEFEKHLADTKNLTEQTIKSVRNLAMGLRPSMLDDLGLEPALQWQIREFSRRSGIDVSIDIDENLQDLSDSVRTCIYRVVQESLTNCARHAEAYKAHITLHGSGDIVNLVIKDDGKGFDVQSASGSGLGLIGMKERVSKLGGTLTITSQNLGKQRGTILCVELPLTLESKS